MYLCWTMAIDFFLRRFGGVETPGACDCLNLAGTLWRLVMRNGACASLVTFHLQRSVRVVPVPGDWINEVWLYLPLFIGR